MKRALIGLSLALAACGGANAPLPPNGPQDDPAANQRPAEAPANKAAAPAEGKPANPVAGAPATELPVLPPGHEGIGHAYLEAMARFAADEMLELRSSAARKSEELFRKSVADQRVNTEGLQVDNIEWKQDGRTWLCTFDLSVVRNDGEVLTPVKRSIRLVLEEGQWKVEDAQ